MLTEPTPTTDPAPAAKDTASSPPMPVPVVPGLQLPPDSVRYRLKNKLLGPPLHTEQLEHERLGKPTALAVFASDNLSSSAYATEEMLRVLIPAVGLGAFALVVPITTALLVVLFFLILSYRQTIKAYPTAGGAYMVTRDNFGLLPAQVAGVALLTDYVLTVSVSVAAGTAALASAFSAIHALRPADLDPLRDRDRLGQPARCARVRQVVRRTHVLLHLEHGRADRRRSVQGLSRWSRHRRLQPCTRFAAVRQEGRRAPRRRFARDRPPLVRIGRRGSHGRRSHLERRSRRSRSPSGRTRAARSSSWAHCSA